MLLISAMICEFFRLHPESDLCELCAHLPPAPRWFYQRRCMEDHGADWATSDLALEKALKYTEMSPALKTLQSGSAKSTVHFAQQGQPQL